MKDLKKSDQIEQKVTEVRKILFEEFYEEKTNLIYEFRDPDRKKNLPTAAEIEREIPNSTGWITGMEDCAIAGGAVLQGLIRQYEQTESPEIAVQIRNIWNGLRILGTTGPRGFVIRGLNLTDSVSYYPNSSMDQYKMYCSALCHFLNCDLCTKEDRREISDIATAIIERVMSANMNIPRADGKLGIVGNAGYEVEVAGKPMRIPAPDILLYYALAAMGSGENQWRAEYEQLRDRDNGITLNIGVAERWSVENVKKCRTWIYMQGAHLFRTLYDFETDSKVKKIYRMALKNIATAAIPVLDQYKDHDSGGYFGGKTNFAWRDFYHAFRKVNPGFSPKMMDNGTFQQFCWQGRPALQTELINIRAPFEALEAIMLSEEKELINKIREKAVYMLLSLPVAELQLSHHALIGMDTIYARGKDWDLW